MFKGKKKIWNVQSEELPSKTYAKSSTIQIVKIWIVLAFIIYIPIGYNLAILNPLGDHIPKWLNQTVVQRSGNGLDIDSLKILWAGIVSILIIGGAIGSLIACCYTDKFKRKTQICISALLFCLSAIFFGTCRQAILLEFLYIGRFLCGLCSGFSSITTTKYILELTKRECHNQAMVFISMSIAVGIVFGGLIGLDEILGSDQLWHYGLIVYVSFICGGILFLPLFPESPNYWLVVMDNREKANEVLRQIYGLEKEQQFLEYHLDLIEAENQMQLQATTVKDILKDSKLYLSILLMVLIEGGQQFFGIVALMNYSVSIFEAANIPSNVAKWANFGSCLVNFVFLYIGLSIMVKINRRPVIIASCILCGVLMLFETLIVWFIDTGAWLSHLQVIVIVVFFAVFQLGIGTVKDQIWNEIFENLSRPSISKINIITASICKFIVALVFPNLLHLWNGLVFIPSTVVCFIVGMILICYLPERKHKSLQSTDYLTANITFNNDVESKISKIDESTHI